MNQAEIFEASEAIARGDACPKCGSAWEMTADGTRMLEHKLSCEYLAEQQADLMEAHNQYRSEFGMLLPGNEPMTFEQWLNMPDPEPVGWCPTHGEQLVRGQGTTRGPDPWATEHLACGCEVLDMGVGQEHVKVLRTGVPRTSPMPDLENGPSERDWQA